MLATAGGAAELANPANPGIRKAVQRVLNDAERRQDLIERGHRNAAACSAQASAAARRLYGRILAGR